MRHFLLITFQIIINFCTTAQVKVGLNINGEQPNDYSGYAVALSGDGQSVIIGATQNDANAVNDGHARVYELDMSNSWVQKGGDIEPGNSASDEAGGAVAISADGLTVAVGARFDSNSGGGAAGQVSIYRFTNGMWSILGTSINGNNAFDYSGTSVALSADGNTVAIGAPSYSSFPGSATIFNYDGTNWVQKGNTITGEVNNDNFGWSVSISADGNIVAIGIYKNDGAGVDAGQVRVYEYDSNNWLQKGNNIDGEVANDRFGFSVSLSDDGNTLVAGAPQHTENAYQDGQVRVFNFDGNSWIQLGSSIHGESIGDWLGWSVDISGDASTIAAGAIKNNGDANAFPDVGHSRVFAFDGNNWTIKGNEIDGEIAGDWFGNSVSISYDGTFLAVGAPNHNSYQGHVQVYEFPINQCPINYAGLNLLTGSETVINDYETDGPLESNQTILTGATTNYDSKTEINLLNGFCVEVDASFRAFIDGCGGLY